MENNGFNIVDFANYSTEQQLALVYNANNIICLHGAAMVNLLVAKNDTVILELGFANRICYQDLFEPNADYHRLDCIEIKKIQSNILTRKEDEYSINIDLVKLKVKNVFA